MGWSIVPGYPPNVYRDIHSTVLGSMLPNVGRSVQEDGSVTLLAVTRLDNGNFMCISDRMNFRVDHTGARSYDEDKWMRVESAPRLLWAWAGREDVGLAIAPYVEEGATDWQSLTDAVRPKLRTFVGASFGQATDCLFAGWAGGVPAMLHLGADGGMSGGPGSKRREHFVGAGGFAADLAWKYGNISRPMSLRRTSERY
jgi:hypothetical protein